MQPTLILFVQQGCVACAAAEPIFEEFKRKHPMQSALVLKADGPYPAKFGVKMRSTPTYVIAMHGQMVTKAEGLMKLGQLEKWVQQTEVAIAGHA